MSAGVIAVSAILMGQAGRPPAPAKASWCSSGGLLSSPNRGTFDSLHGIAAINMQDVWAVGNYIDSRGDTRILAEHWDGKRWKLVDAPDPDADDSLDAVTAFSSTDAWAVGGSSDGAAYNAHTLVERWNGSSWNVAPSPGSGYLNGLASLSRTDIWAVGGRILGSNPVETLVEHWDGSKWQTVPSPDPGAYGNSLASVSVTGPSSVWAVGTDHNSAFGSESLVEHWDGAKWSVVHVPEIGLDSNLRSIASAGKDDVWAVGSYEQESPSGTLSLTLTERWNGSRWAIVTSPSPTGDDSLSGVAAVSSSDAWAVGSSAGNPALIMQWRDQAWRLLASPYRRHSLNLLFSVSAPSAADVWAAGLYIELHDYSYHTLTEEVCA